jgi:Fe-S-cluster-containing dehydrogenase component
MVFFNQGILLDIISKRKEKMKQLTTPRMDQCIGCHTCSVACARLVFKKFSWHTAGIRIHSSGGLSTGFIASRCLACDPPPCAETCPTGAFGPRPGGGVIVKNSLCIQCGDCIGACPVEAIQQDRQGNVYVCIHCGRCVEFCPQGCLEMVDSRDIEEVVV